MRAQILISGATGTIGGATVRALQARGIGVRIGTRNPDEAQHLVADADEVVPFEFGNEATLDAAFDGVTSFLLITPFVEGTPRLANGALRAAKRAGVKHVVKLSAAGVSPEAPAQAVRDHAAVEALVRDSGMTWTIVRPTFFMDNFINFQGETLKSNGEFYGSAGDGAVAYISSDDVGRVMAAALTSPEAHAGEVHELTGPQALTETEAASALSNAFGRGISYVDVGDEAFAGSLRSTGTPEFHVEALVFLENVKRQGWASAVSSGVEEVIGQPAETFEQFLARNRERLS